MNESLREFIGAVRRHVQRAVLAVGASVALCVSIWSAAAWCAVDWFFRFGDPFVRWMGTVAVVAAAGSAVWRYLIRPLVWFPDELALARAVERRIPALRDRLVAAVQFALGAPAEATA
ncbi:MAG: hypothetical protein D6725_17200, partial [Planctomycetota bacterium]